VPDNEIPVSSARYSVDIPVSSSLYNVLEYPSSIGLEPENETGYTGLVGGMYEDFVELYFEISVNGMSKLEDRVLDPSTIGIVINRDIIFIPSKTYTGNWL
jgi:hypothetical protein